MEDVAEIGGVLGVEVVVVDCITEVTGGGVEDALFAAAGEAALVEELFSALVEAEDVAEATGVTSV